MYIYIYIYIPTCVWRLSFYYRDRYIRTCMYIYVCVHVCVLNSARNDITIPDNNYVY